MKSEGAGFLKRARAESRRYGDDPWVFFRELGQNSRDAFATRIDVRVEQASLLRLEFSDDGKGMSFEHARRYFFRLYSSSKDRDRQAAGRYGVGFWSVLRFEADTIEVHSRSSSGAWGVSLSGDLEDNRRIECLRQKTGTTIVLERSLPAGELPEFLLGLEAGLIRYLSRLGTAHRKARSLPVRLNGKRINRPFRLKGSGSLAFQDRAVEGVVGFGERPRYELYARGLPVGQGYYLEELEGARVRRRSRSEQHGTYPVYLLNGNQLDVVLSRQMVLKNRSLSRLIETARRRFDQLVSQTVGRTVERSWFLRFWDRVGGFLDRTGQVPAWTRWALFLVALFTLGGILGVLATRLPDGGQRIPNAQPQAEVAPAAVTRDALRAPALAADRLGNDWESTVDRPGPEPAWALAYQPGLPLNLRLTALDRFDPQKGWQPGSSGTVWTRPEALDRPGQTVTIDLTVAGASGWLLLPLPSGYAPVRGSGRRGRRAIRLLTNPAGQLRVRVPKPEALRISYQVSKSGRPVEMPLTALVDMHFPDQVEKKLARIARKPVGRRIAETLELVRSLVGYDRSPATVERFRGSLEKDWIARVISTGAGDCDLINGLLATMLQRVGVPARLAIGIVGREGRAIPGTHAWVEALAWELVVLDATAGMTPRTPPGAGPGTLPAASAASPPESGAGWASILLLVFSALALACLTVLVLRRLPRPGELELDADNHKRRELLAGMALEAIRRPGAWVEIPGLWHRPFIPCLDKPAVISLARLLRLASRDLLFIGRRDNPLCRAAVRSGARVLDRDDREFQPLFERLANLRDLDELMDFRPVKLKRGPDRELLERVNRLLDGSRAGVRLQASGVSDARVLVDIDVSPIRGMRGGFPQRFVAVNTADPWWRRVVEISEERPELAVCLVVDRLGRDSILLRPRAALVRRRAARAVLRAGLAGRRA